MAGKTRSLEKTKNKTRPKNWNRRKLPSKRSINLAAIGIKRTNPIVAMAGILIILAAAGAFGKFLVADRLAAVSVAQSRVSNLKTELDKGYAQLDQMGDVADNYAHYTFSGMSAAELTQADRMQVIDLLDRLVISKAVIGSWRISGNQLNVPIEGATLEKINEIVQELQTDPLVDFCTVTTAATSDLKSGKKAVKDDSTVLAQVTVYLKYNEQFTN